MLFNEWGTLPILAPHFYGHSFCIAVMAFVWGFMGTAYMSPMLWGLPIAMILSVNS